jgi:hypothetical protein
MSWFNVFATDWTTRNLGSILGKGKGVFSSSRLIVWLGAHTTFKLRWKAGEE